MTISNNEVFVCDWCNEDFLEEEVIHMYSNDFYCGDCYEEHESFECPDCCEHYTREDGIYSNDKDCMYCEDCIENDHSFCEKCEEYAIQEDGAVDGYGTFYCESCACEYLTNCDHCDELHNSEDMHSDGNISLCTTCLEDNYYSCVSCYDFVHVNNTLFDTYDEPYCRYCYTPSGTIHNYSYKPTPIFHHTRNDLNISNLPYYGLELELEGDTSAENVRAMLEVLNGSLDDENNAYLKKDCTCSVEVVSHPMSLEYHRKRMSWHDFLELCKSLGFISHNAPQCGIHAHVSNSAFIDDDHRALFVYLFEYYYKQVKQITRRKQRQIENWCMNYDLGEFETPRDLLERAINTNHIRRSSILNFSSQTIEVRAFRGTLIHNSFMACIELVDAFFHISMIFRDYASHQKPLEGIMWKDIVHYIASSGYEELHQFITRKGVE